VRTDLGFVLGNRLEYLGDTMSDIVLYDISDEKHGKQHSYSRIDKIQHIICPPVRQGNQMMMDEVYGKLQKYSSETTGYTDKKRQNHQDIPFGKFP